LSAESQPIADVFEGSVVKVRGVLRYGNSSLVAPLSGALCAACHVEVRDRGSSSWWYGMHSWSTPWSTLFEQTRGEDFLIEPADGGAGVLAAASSLALVDHGFRLVEEIGVWRAPSPRASEILRLAGVVEDGALWRRPISICERRISEGDAVAVLGVARWRPLTRDVGPGEPDYRTAARELCLEGDPLLVGSDPELRG